MRKKAPISLLAAFQEWVKTRLEWCVMLEGDYVE